VPLFNKDFMQYHKIISPGKVFFIIGNKSNFNGNEDGLLRVLPNSLIDFKELPAELSGEIKININNEQLKNGFLTELGTKISHNTGKFKLITKVQREDLNNYQLESRKLFFPNEALLNWLEKEKIDFQVRVTTNGKNN